MGSDNFFIVYDQTFYVRPSIDPDISVLFRLQSIKISFGGCHGFNAFEQRQTDI